MLHLNEAPDIRSLVQRLASLLVEPPDDPMAPDWIAVPTSGIERWTKLELARLLGASPGACDGVAANIVFTFPGRLRQLVLDASQKGSLGDSPDPWQIERLVWTVMEVLASPENSDRLALMPPLPEGASRYGRARRIADLYDRYALHRPELLQSWVSGQGERGHRHTLTRELAWQPVLYQLVREKIGQPSSPERLDANLQLLRAGELTLDLPSRLSVFGATSLPGGEHFLELVEAIAIGREVHCYFLEPSPRTARRVEHEVLDRRLRLPLTRSEDRMGELVEHPLLNAWGAPFRERSILLGAARNQREIPFVNLVTTTSLAGGVKAPITLLERMQEDLREDRRPNGSFELESTDCSVEIHGCYGQSRQVEVIRDAILHLLEDDRDLAEEDIIVLCPSIAEFAPYIEAGFGTKFPRGSGRFDGRVADLALESPWFAYQLSDRSLRSTHDLNESLDALLALASGRCGASEVFDFLALGPVSRRFGFDDAALETVREWINTANIRWGLNERHRASNGFDRPYPLNTWRRAIESLCFGVAVRDIDLEAPFGGVAPIGVEGGDIDLAGQLADLIARLESYVDLFVGTHSPRQWCDLLSGAVEDLFEAEPYQDWQVGSVRRMLAGVVDNATIGEREVDVEITLAEIRSILADGLRGSTGRSNFFRGGVTVTSLTPLRWIPFKVVCLLGLDDGAMREVTPSGDDMIALSPRVGDPDPRSESRQSLLEAILAAQQRLIITYSAFDHRTNLTVPKAVELMEFRETTLATLTLSSREVFANSREHLHPRQSYNGRNFEEGAFGHAGPWSFDPVALKGAIARIQQETRPRFLVEHPVKIEFGDGGVVSIEELREFIVHPVRSFFKRTLQIYRPFEIGERSEELPIVVDPLELANIGRRLLAARLSRHDDGSWERDRERWWERERARGSLPVGVFADSVTADIDETVDGLVFALRAFGIDAAAHRESARSLDIEVGEDETRPRKVIGQLMTGSYDDFLGTSWSGTWRAVYSRAKSVDALSSWLDLLLLTAHEPKTIWRSVSVSRRATAGKGRDGRTNTGIVDLTIAGDTPKDRLANAQRGLSTVVRLFDLGSCEPLPLFGELSSALQLGIATESDWRSGPREMYGDGNDADNILAFGKLTLSEVLAIPSRDKDPGEETGEETGRAKRLADVLWGTFAMTTNVGPGPVDGRPSG